MGRPKKEVADETDEVMPVKEVENKVKISAAIEIMCKPSEREAAAEAKYMELMDDAGGVMAKNNDCGGSVYYNDFENFPKSNCRCTCGQPGHFIVKFTTV
jgi:hypothetical protein